MKCPIPYCTSKGKHEVSYVESKVCEEHKYLTDMDEDDVDMAAQIAMIDIADSLRRLITLLEDAAMQQIKGRYS